MTTLDPSIVLAMAAVVAMLGASSLFVKHKLRQIDRRVAEGEADKAADAPPTTTR